MYGEKQEVTYYCTDLLWGQKLYQELRFVLVQYNGSRSILVSTDLSLSPKRIIELYAYRFSIEELFREFKQQIGGFAYHFWSKAVPKLNRFSRKERVRQTALRPYWMPANENVFSATSRLSKDLCCLHRSPWGCCS